MPKYSEWHRRRPSSLAWRGGDKCHHDLPAKESRGNSFGDDIEGAVREILSLGGLKIEPASEGEAIDFAKRFREAIDGIIVCHPQGEYGPIIIPRPVRREVGPRLITGKFIIDTITENEADGILYEKYITRYRRGRNME